MTNTKMCSEVCKLATGIAHPCLSLLGYPLGRGNVKLSLGTFYLLRLSRLRSSFTTSELLVSWCVLNVIVFIEINQYRQQSSNWLSDSCDGFLWFIGTLIEPLAILLRCSMWIYILIHYVQAICVHSQIYSTDIAKRDEEEECRNAG